MSTHKACLCTGVTIHNLITDLHGKGNEIAQKRRNSFSLTPIAPEVSPSVFTATLTLCNIIQRVRFRTSLLFPDIKEQPFSAISNKLLYIQAGYEQNNLQKADMKFAKT